MKNPIAPNTKIRILSPEHSEYVQKLAFEAGFEWANTGKSVQIKDVIFMFFQEDMTIAEASHEVVFARSPEKEIFIDLPTEAELKQAASDTLNNSNDLLVKSGAKNETIDESVRNTFNTALEEGAKKAQIEVSVNRLARKAEKFAAMKKVQNPVTPKHSHYFKDVSDLDEVDVYRVCDLFEVNDNSGAIQHSLKKLLCSGQRGAKGYRKDLEEARDSIQRKLDLMAEDGE